MATPTYWFVATGTSAKDETTPAALLSLLKARTKEYCEPKGRPCKFDVPSGENSLKFGSFDDLIRLTDELQKYDSQVESVLRRFERMIVELNEKKDDSKKFEPSEYCQVLSQRTWFSFDKYIQNWQWDEGKYPKSRGLANTLTSLLTTVNQFDEAARTKTTALNELKTQEANLAKKTTGTLASIDLIDVLTPGVVSVSDDETSDFIETNFLTTVIIVVPGGVAKDYFLNGYEYWDEKVVPGSAKKLYEEKDGSAALYRVIVWKASLEAFKKKCREEKYVVRDFTFSEQKFKDLQEDRKKLDKELETKDKNMKAFCKASWSDCMVAWVHVKAMRVFVESVLRFGVPPMFSAFLIQPKGNTIVQLRKELAMVLGGSSKTGPSDEAAKDAEDEEYYPYVSLSFTPFSAKAS